MSREDRDNDFFKQVRKLVHGKIEDKKGKESRRTKAKPKDPKKKGRHSK